MLRRYVGQVRHWGLRVQVAWARATAKPCKPCLLLLMQLLVPSEVACLQLANLSELRASEGHGWMQGCSSVSNTAAMWDCKHKGVIVLPICQGACWCKDWRVAWRVFTGGRGAHRVRGAPVGLSGHTCGPCRTQLWAETSASFQTSPCQRGRGGVKLASGHWP